VVQALLGAEADVNKADNDGDDSTVPGLLNGHLEVVQALLGAEADVNKADNNGITPLHLASLDGALGGGAGSAGRGGRCEQGR
jgi:ankyrin repeat protein